MKKLSKIIILVVSFLGIALSVNGIGYLFHVENNNDQSAIINIESDSNEQKVITDNKINDVKLNFYYIYDEEDSKSNDDKLKWVSSFYYFELIIEEELSSLSNEQIIQLNELRRLGCFPRQEAVIRGLIDKNAQRLDEATAKQLGDSGVFGNDWTFINKILPYPDYIGGIETSRVEYWFDDNGSKKLIYNYDLKKYEIVDFSYSNKMGKVNRQEAINKNLINEEAPRLSVEITKDIILSSSSFDEILSKLYAVQPYFDKVSGSGVTKLEYWMDNDCKEKIIVYIELEKIIVNALSREDSTPIIGTLYGGRKTIVFENDRFSEHELQEYEIRGLNEEQIEELRAVREKGWRSSCKFYRQEAVIRGLIDENAPRLDVATVKEIIQNSSSFKEILDKMYEIQRYPDCYKDFSYYNSIHPIIINFWLDESGTEMISVSIEIGSSIKYISFSEDGSRIEEILYKYIKD